jgi:hypothetical protein
MGKLRRLRIRNRGVQTVKTRKQRRCTARKKAAHKRKIDKATRRVKSLLKKKRNGRIG